MEDGHGIEIYASWPDDVTEGSVMSDKWKVVRTCRSQAAEDQNDVNNVRTITTT